MSSTFDRGKYIKQYRTMLDKMIDELYDAGVDTSYFPKAAEDALDKYSVLLFEDTLEGLKLVGSKI